MMWRFEGTRGQEDVLDYERGGGQPGGDDKVGSFPCSNWCVVAATVLASPIAVVQINVLLPSLLIASLVTAASLFHFCLIPQFDQACILLSL